ncbi:hypothetical protein P153DRAFT_389088 [Dothidotthia symphoricarpi CBS 119687]|uniref:Uncharacterized protein n=1 Tax=Dothidotthia symphoricarpi CBS 119687 TaxID=1392245 RepID=A0A6A6A273_9PLEO|nr:uncharacterized protein P153DRAFT_389088 [Dothidotthia symphoricarpi CBS 119687]KAF2125636.1 hypothetical protein P153DRAFT_389088 [Dothidotthia symphoricarpi CBS 119687]
MRTSTPASALLFLASAVVAQSSEGLFTIQTSIPCDCIMEPCTECSSHIIVPETSISGVMSIPGGDTLLRKG